MKACSKIIIFISILYMASACSHNVDVETVVHPDGSIDRSVTLALEDSVAIEKNFFGIDQTKGWQTSIRHLSKGEIAQMKRSDEGGKGEFIIQFKKSFPSVEEANREMNSDVDTLFHIRSAFEKKFRWFYTYMRYSDTYVAANRFKYVSPDDFFTPEDHTFINRLPSDTRTLSKADSIYLKSLNSKIEEDFAIRGYYEDFYQTFIEVLMKNKVEQQWIDTLSKYKESIYTYQVVLKEGKKAVEDSLNFNFILFRAADSLNIPFPHAQTFRDYEDLKDGITARSDFMNHVVNGEYAHSVRMPWPVIDTNADSVSGNNVVWKPHYLKFAFKDYEMYAESRKINYIPVAISAVVVVLTVALIIRSRKKKYAMPV